MNIPKGYINIGKISIEDAKRLSTALHNAAGRLSNYEEAAKLRALENSPLALIAETQEVTR